MELYWVLARSAFRKNTAYLAAHLATNVGSLLFGLVYIALWRAATRGHAVGSYSAATLAGYIALGQTVLWLTTFLPRDLGLSALIRSGQIAVELIRPAGFLPRTAASASGEVLYNLVFRSLPMALVFTLLGVFPLQRVAGAGRLPAFFVALLLGVLTGILIQYLIGLSAFWTTETRWARRLYFALTMFCGGQLLPLALMPAILRHILVWLPFQSMLYFPVSVWLGLARGLQWWSAAIWTALLWSLAAWMTRRAMRRLAVQGG
ncbi:MAG: hypothetical protein M0Z53_07290 [Thermaerobacter sp.]|nr:hypothetical protein [Thermaerobacter sp.]